MDLSNIKVILASKSPRRRELLSRIIAEFQIETRDVDEVLPASIHPRDGVELLAVKKGAPISLEYPTALVISSDTLVELNGVPLGKPRSEADAYRMLRMLSGATHNVHTGVAVTYMGEVYSGVASSAVSFRELADEEIWEYIKGGEPMDKAGAYGIQGDGGKFVAEYKGDFDTIMGLSLSLTERLIKEATSQND